MTNAVIEAAPHCHQLLVTENDLRAVDPTVTLPLEQYLACGLHISLIRPPIYIRHIVNKSVSVLMPHRDTIEMPHRETIEMPHRETIEMPHRETSPLSLLSQLRDRYIFFFFFILRRMGKNKALAHHTSTIFNTRRVSI